MVWYFGILLVGWMLWGWFTCVYTIKDHSLLCISNDDKDVLVTDNVFLGMEKCSNSFNKEWLETRGLNWALVPPGEFWVFPIKIPWGLGTIGGGIEVHFLGSPNFSGLGSHTLYWEREGVNFPWERSPNGG